MTGGEGVLEEDMAQGTEGDLLIRLIHLILKQLCYYSWFLSVQLKSYVLFRYF